MKVSEIVQAPGDWQVALQVAGGNVEKAKMLLAIGWHETHFGRLGWGRSGYHLGVGAYSATNANPAYQGLEKQFAWTAPRLPDAFTLDTMQKYGLEKQKPTNADGTNTGAAWGKSVFSIYQGIVVDLPVDKPAGPVIPVPSSDPVDLAGLATLLAAGLVVGAVIVVLTPQSEG